MDTIKITFTDYGPIENPDGLDLHPSTKAGEVLDKTWNMGYGIVLRRIQKSGDNLIVTFSVPEAK